MRGGSEFASVEVDESDGCGVAGGDGVELVAGGDHAAALGRKQVFQIPPGRREHRTWWDLPTGTFARPLFARDLTYTELANRLNDDSKVTATRLTERFGLHDYLRTHPNALVLFTVNPKGGIDIASDNNRRAPRPGDTIVALTST